MRSIRVRVMLVFYVFLGLCVRGVRGQSVVAPSVDVWINLTLSGVDPSTVDTSALNSTELINRLNLLASTDSDKYFYLANALIRSNQEIFTENSVMVLECPIGSYIAASGLCTPCPAGRYSETPRATSVGVCQSCVAGTWSNATGASNRSVCQSCPIGTYSGTAGASSSSVCSSCGAGMTSVAGAGGTLSCVCQVGFYRSTPGGACVECEPGYFCSSERRETCPGFNEDASLSYATSMAMAVSRFDCFCLAGYHGIAGSDSGCQMCPVNSYCTGEIRSDAFVKNQAVINSCPEFSLSPVRSTRLDQCVCQSSYRKQASSPASRGMTVTAAPCNCTNLFRCEVSGCAGCSSGNACPNGRTLTCRQGHVDLVLTQSTAGGVGWVASATWTIAPAGATRIFLRLTDLVSGSSNNILSILQCKTAACNVDTAYIETGVFNTVSLRGYATSPGYGVVKVMWSATASLSTTSPFKLEYASQTPCDGNGATLPVTLGGVTYLATGETQLYPPQLDPTWPLVAWMDDQLTFTEYPGSASVAVDVVSGSVSGPSATPGYAVGQTGYLRDWVAPSVGVYFVVDLAMPGRGRQLNVLPVGARTVTVYYAYATVSGAASFTLSGAVEGGGSPDIVLVVGDTLVMSRLSGTDGVMLLQSYNATSGAYTAVGGVIGQSTPVESQPSLTWDTTGRDPGQFFYARATGTGDVKVGRVLLYAAPGGARCIVCQAGEYCFNGNAVQCPPNSVSPEGSTSVSDCQCSRGFSVATTDLDAYGNSQTVDTGGRHSCVVDSVGGLWCWGANENGQLGLGNLAGPVPQPTQVPNLAGVKNVSLGEDFTCVVYGASSRVKCWGSNYYGQLGLDSDALVQESVGDDALLAGFGGSYSAKFLSCGMYSCCAIVIRSSAEALTCWGRGGSGQLGQGSTTANRKNVGTGMSNALAGGSLVGVAARHSYANTGTFSLGFGGYVAAQVTMGGEHACAVMVGGEVFCWGRNDVGGAVGVGTTTGFYTPTQVSLGGQAKTVNCYNFVCCAVMRVSFQVKCWGKGGDGRTGVGLLDIGRTTASMGVNLQPVALGTNVYAIDVNVGGFQTCALLSTNAVKCWGVVRGAVIGDNPPVEMSDVLPNVELLGTRVVLQISGKGTSTCVVMSDYKVACWGSDNSLGQLGGAPVSSGGMNMTLVGLGEGVVALASSGSPQRVTCAVCGANSYCSGGATLAQSCPVNTFSAIQSWAVSQCQCLPGYKRSGSASAGCQMCSGVEYCVAGSAYTCGVNSATVRNGSSDASQCQCATGYFLSGVTQVCTACAQGQYKDTVGNAAGCSLCPAGTRGNRSALGSVSGCVQCGGGTFSSAGSVACSACGSGYAAVAGSASCVQCGAGFFSDGTYDVCRPCPVGTFDDDPQTGQPGTCASCSAGTFSAALNATHIGTCRNCPAGFVSSSGAGACRACGFGEYSLEGTSQCLACPGNSTSSNGSAYGGCYCLPGFYKKFAADGQQFSCVACGPGEFSAGGPGALACQKCPPGRASRAVGAVSDATCGVCPAGQFASEGSSVCSSCPLWSFSSAAGAGVCANCSFGYFAGTGATVCQACSAGYYSLVPIGRAADCLECPPGKFCIGAVQAVLQGKPQVQDCPAGTYKNEPRLSSVGQCTQCEQNFFCPSPTMIGACPPGTTSNAGSVSQLQCTCQTGFTCNYQRMVNAVVTLQMSQAEFESNEQVKEAFKAAVAAAARTTVSKVNIVKVVSRSGGARRRMLSAGNGEVLHVVMEIHDGEGSGLDSELDARLAKVGLRAGGYKAWIEPHHVTVSRD